MHWLPHDTAETDGLKRGDGQRINSAAARELPSLLTSGLSFTYNNNNVHLSCAHQRPQRSHDTY